MFGVIGKILSHSEEAAREDAAREDAALGPLRGGLRGRLREVRRTGPTGRRARPPISGRHPARSCPQESYASSCPDVTGWCDVSVSSRQGAAGALTDGSTETFWESGDEDRNKAKWLQVAFPGGAPPDRPHLVCVHVDNTRDTLVRNPSSPAPPTPPGSDYTATLIVSEQDAARDFPVQQRVNRNVPRARYGS